MLDVSYVFEGVMAVNMGIGLSVAFILQLCKFMFRDWLTKDDIQSNNFLTLCAISYSLFIFVVLCIYK